MMSKSQTDFDPVGVVVDWIDAYRQRELSTLIALYDDAAIVDCCEGGRFIGRAELERYWQSKLIRSIASAFEIDVLMPEADGVLLDYKGHDGKAVRTLFRFNHYGKISHTACTQLQHNGSSGLAA
jgi:hypothetical protein